ncbi:MAG: LemA family protein [Mycoplasmataceae bacterium]|nr:LemA family protein [Mycoplasmataceae bacterium]
MLLDTREKNDQQSEGFNPNVINAQRDVSITSGAKIAFWIMFIFLWFTIIGGIVITVWKVGKGNYFKTQQEKINEAASGIDVQLKKRRDTLVKLVDATQTSVKFEKSLLTDITRLRNVNVSPNDTDGLAKTDLASASALSRLMATFENYPNLKTTDTIRDLMSSADYIEREIAASRRLYNATALQFNQTIQAWPANVVAASMKLHSFALFAASEQDKQDVSLKMDA